MKLWEGGGGLNPLLKFPHFSVSDEIYTYSHDLISRLPAPGQFDMSLGFRGHPTISLTQEQILVLLI